MTSQQQDVTLKKPGFVFCVTDLLHYYANLTGRNRSIYKIRLAIRKQNLAFSRSIRVKFEPHGYSDVTNILDADASNHLDTIDT